ncbi:putative acetoacetyl-CoA synthase [Trichodelitschia bisporula]|uniref:Putative acetoacetyl-CoA synthase n=1 Tax=Trichodelitschia bisporula TaxID=703511 RepID=A0A6G1HU59_9PEZI|nr:putative acetoacetyl-CoA synthase [Trichodelitschia bisporula]
MEHPTPLWRPEDPESTPISIYRLHINNKFNLALKTSHDLHRWTIRNPHAFWLDIYAYVGLKPALPPSFLAAGRAFEDKDIKDVPRFFNGINLNYAENVLTDPEGATTALINLREGEKLDGVRWSWDDLRENVRRARSALLRSGVKMNDRVAALMSNSSWTIALFLATVSIGAVFTSISPDMGLEGCTSRLLQVEPTIFFADSSQTFKAKRRSMEEKIVQIVAALKKKPQVVIVPLATVSLPYTLLDDFLARASPADKLEYARVPFSHPLVILYSSGTTGPPKCIVHQHGAVIQLKKIALLHNSLTPRDIVFQYSSTSWVLWNIMNGHLATGAAVICYDGSPLYPDAATKLRICEHHRVTYFGTSPRYLLELEMSHIPPSNFDLSSLRMVTTTGATLTAAQFHWFYAAFPSKVHLSSVAGGTEIMTSWVCSDPAGDVYPGEMQMPALGQDVDVADAETGASIKHTGRPGELVCRTPFPSMPVYFWGDEGGKKYREAYFERFDNISVWAQHDWIQFNPATGGCQIHGRSDGTLNPSGIRFGSAEIYSIVEAPAFSADIADTLCVGRKRPNDGDETVFLFVRLHPGRTLTPSLRSRIESAIRTSLSPRHVPRFIEPVPEIPVTINGKKVEIAVKKIISGADVRVSSTVANPACLRDYVRFRNAEPRAKL